MLFAWVENENHRTKLETLYFRYRKLMFKVAFEILCDKTLAEDAVSESFMRVYRNIEKVSDENSPQTKNFLVVICRNTAKDILKKHSVTVYTDDLDHYTKVTVNNSKTDPQNILVGKETVNILSEMVENLPHKYKDVIYMQNAYKMSREEIAKALGINVETVKKRLQRARAMLKEELRKEQEKYEKIR